MQSIQPQLLLRELLMVKRLAFGSQLFSLVGDG